MDRIQAKEKINKLLRLANDKGATSSERDTALEMAKKLATKYGFRIQKGAPSTSNQNNAGPATLNKHRYNFDLNCFNKKFVNFLFKFIGITDYFFTGKKTVYIYDYQKFDVVSFKNYYKHFVSVYYALKGNLGLKEKEFFHNFNKTFCDGYFENKLENAVYRSAYNLGMDLRNTRIVY